MAGKAFKVAYVITKRDDRSYWNRIGVGFVNRDGSINVKLDALPVSGEFQLRDYVPFEERSAPGEGFPPGADFKAPEGGDGEIPF